MARSSFNDKIPIPDTEGTHRLLQVGSGHRLVVRLNRLVGTDVSLIQMGEILVYPQDIDASFIYVIEPEQSIYAHCAEGSGRFIMVSGVIEENRYISPSAPIEARVGIAHSRVV